MRLLSEIRWDWKSNAGWKPFTTETIKRIEIGYSKYQKAKEILRKERTKAEKEHKIMDKKFQQEVERLKTLDLCTGFFAEKREYRIDFGNMSQFNTKTKNSRRIRRYTHPKDDHFEGLCFETVTQFFQFLISIF